ncbi:hemicentin-2-like [Haliotis asinina]|uniref:hemicentin-2-like n=1 Tax=Haliotis asinina TaxID=109174 RepID=UPI003531B897
MTPKVSIGHSWQIIGMSRTGMSFRAIGREWNLSHTTISRLIAKLGTTGKQGRGGTLDHGGAFIVPTTAGSSYTLDTIPSPARNPDLNALEHLWDILRRQVKQREPPVSSLQELSQTLVEEWNRIPLRRTSCQSVGGSVTVSGSGGTGTPNQQALTLRCSYTVTPGDVVIEYTWKRVEDSSTVTIASGSVTAQTVVFQDSWQNKGVFVGDYTSTLDIQLPASQMNSSYAGKYRCEVSTLSISVHADVDASVFTPPSISGLPQTQTVTEFSNIRIDCSTFSTPGHPPTTSYRWTYGGSTVSTGAVVDRRNISRTQGGDHTCTASNSQGSDSASVSVDVQYSASIRKLTANSVSGSVIIKESSTVTLICQVESNPNPVIKLVNGSQEMRRTDNALTATYTLELNCRQRGNFSCTASNNIGEPVTQSVELLVQCSPRLDDSVSKELKFAASLGGDVTVAVSVLAYPLPTFIWSRSISTSQDLTGSSSPVSDISVTARLRLTNLQYQDFGDYYLTVGNGVGGSVTCTVRVVHVGELTMSDIIPTQFRDLDNATASSLLLSGVE